MIKYLSLLAIVLLTACSGRKPAEVKEAPKPQVTFEGSLIQPLYLGYLFDSPNSFGPVWNLDACRKLKFGKISMYVKGGFRPNHMSEKITYTFNAKGEPKDFSHYQYDASIDPFSSSSFVYKEGKLAKIDISKYLDFTNLPPVFIQGDSSRMLAITSKGAGKSDSLLFYPSVENPKVVVEIVNNFINSIEIFAAKGSNAEDLRSIALSVDSNLVDFDLTERTVTYMENGLPVESYHLDKSWHTMERSKLWDYNASNQPVKYKEWLHGTLIKDILINYSDNNLPSEIIVDRKKYIFYTAFQ